MVPDGYIVDAAAGKASPMDLCNWPECLTHTLLAPHSASDSLCEFPRAPVRESLGR